MKLNNEDITVCISTYNDRIFQAELLANDFFNLNFKVVILHQTSNVYSPRSSKFKYVALNSKGVAKSRNEGIRQVETEFIWFMDDDVKIISKNIEKLRITLENNQEASAHLFKIVDEEYTDRKNYKVGLDLKKINILNVGTIEIICRVSSLKENNIYFNENFGAGTDLPLGDESIFISKFIDLNFKVNRYNLALLVHPKESSGTNWSEQNLLSKKLSFVEIFGKFLGLIMYFAFFVKIKLR